MTRRALLRKGVDLGWAAGLVALTGSLASCSSGARTQRIAPLHADAVVSSYGIQIHSSFRDSVYAQYDEITQLLQDLGARCVRDRLVTTVPESVEYLEHLGDRGITTLLTISDDSRYPGHHEDPAAVIARMSKHLTALAGDNEPNAEDRPPDWVARTVELQQWIWDVGQNLGLTVCSPSLKQSAPTLEEDYSALSAESVGDLCDVIAIHNYPRGRSPSEGIDQYAAMARGALGGDKDVYCTEGGYFTAPNYKGGAMTMSEDAQALYAPRQLLEYVRRGMRFWQYELMDDPDPDGTDRESHFGIVATPSLDPASWRRKPAFDTMKDLLGKTADPGPAYEPAPISISVDGPVDLENIVLGRRDGSYQVVCWRDVDVYDPESRSPIDVEPEKVTVSVEGGSEQSFDVAGAAVVVPLNG
jgi:hypothetical protein